MSRVLIVIGTFDILCKTGRMRMTVLERVFNIVCIFHFRQLLEKTHSSFRESLAQGETESQACFLSSTPETHKNLFVLFYLSLQSTKLQTRLPNMLCMLHICTSKSIILN